MASEAKELLKLCKEFIQRNNIVCEEDIYMRDSVFEDAFEFINEMCDLIGYADGVNDN